MDMGYRGLIGLFLLVVLMGVFLWFSHGRTLDCRITAQENGASIIDAVKLCKP